MVELIAENGKTAKLTGMASARDRKDKLAMKALGSTDLNRAEFMFGQMVTVLRVNGSMAVDMDSVLNIEENGLTKVNGKKDSKLGTEYRNHKAELVMKEAGLLVCKKVMESKFTLTEVRVSLADKNRLQGRRKLWLICRQMSSILQRL